MKKLMVGLDSMNILGGFSLSGWSDGIISLQDLIKEKKGGMKMEEQQYIYISFSNYYQRIGRWRHRVIWVDKTCFI